MLPGLVARVYHLHTTNCQRWWVVLVVVLVVLQCKWRCKSSCTQRTHVLRRAHLAHRSRGFQCVHEEKSARMLRLRVTARRKTGWTDTEEGWTWTDSTADERRQHEGGGGCGKDRRPKAVGCSQAPRWRRCDLPSLSARAARHFMAPL